MSSEYPTTNVERLELVLSQTESNGKPRQTKAGKRGMRFRTPFLAARDEFKNRWIKGNEERMLESLKQWRRFGGMTLRIRFELKDSDKRFRSLAGKTVVIRKVPTQGKLMEIVDNLILGALEEAKK